jgi:translocation and assembly module TamB
VKRFRKLLAWIAGLLVLLAVIIALSPYWIGLVLPTVLSRYHIHYARSEATTYSRLKLHDVTYASGGTKFTARQVELLTPLVWVWNKFRHPEASFLNAKDWTLTFAETNNAPSTNTNVSQAVTRAKSEINNVRQWVARLDLQNGKIESHGQTFPVPNATFSNGTLSANVGVQQEQVAVDGSLGPNFPWVVHANIPQRDLHVETVLTNASTLGGTISWHTNRAAFAATFSAGPLPDQASIEVKGFRVSAIELDLRGYSDVTGSLTAHWEDGVFDMSANASATPSPGSTNLQPFVATIAARGNTNAAMLETLTITSPVVEAHLSAPLAFSFQGEMLSRAAAFAVKADLSKQHFVPVSGFVSGTASLHRKEGTYPEVVFDVSGNHINGFDIETAEIKTHGRLNWPVAELQKLNVRFVNGTVADITTTLDLEKRFVQSGTIAFTGKIGEDLLPVGYDYERLNLRANFSGSLHALQHSGELSLGQVVAPYLKTFRASAKWNGQGAHLKNFDAEMRVSDGARLLVAGSAAMQRDGNTRNIRAKLERLNVLSGNEEFGLKVPANFSAQIIRTNKHISWSSDLSSTQLRSQRGDLMLEASVQWPNVGRFSIYGHRLDTQLANPFLIRPVPQMYLQQIDAAARWSNGPAKWNIDTIADITPPLTNMNQTPFAIRVQTYGDANGTVVTNLSVSQNTNPVVAVHGVLPLTIEPARANAGAKEVFRLNDDEPIQFHAETRHNAAFWDALVQRFPITIRDPFVQLSIAGTLREPRGTMRLEVPSGSMKLLTNAAAFKFTNLRANATLDRHQIHLLELDTLIEGQPIWATATLPVPADIEHNWRQLFDWRKATAQIRANDVQIAPFADLESRFISPQGALSANVRIDQGSINGSIVVTNVATKPIAQFGILRDVSAQLRFTQGRVDIERCVGTLSGAPVALFGWADISHFDPKTKLPRFRINVRGDSVPLVRRSDVIVRAKFDLVAVNTNTGPGLVTGDVEFQNSYILNELRFLVPPRAAKPAGRPPYFSVEAEPFSAWKIDVNVKGDRFLRVRNPFFNGQGSINMHLGGTLGEPIALGDATINSGTVQFPFANVTVNQGFVTLTAAHPYMPHLFINGSTKAYDFDIRMNITGPVNDPKIEFTSTPGLPSEQILVMLTTGELPATATTLSLQQRTLRVGAFVGKSFLSRFGLGGGDQRLILQSGRDLSQQNTETYSVEYKVSPDWSVIGDYNKFGGLNVGLKWRFYSK